MDNFLDAEIPPSELALQLSRIFQVPPPVELITARPARPGPKWDVENKIVDCSNPPRGPFETEQVLKAYREGWTVICSTGHGDIEARKK